MTRARYVSLRRGNVGEVVTMKRPRVSLIVFCIVFISFYHIWTIINILEEQGASEAFAGFLMPIISEIVMNAEYARAYGFINIYTACALLSILASVLLLSNIVLLKKYKRNINVRSFACPYCGGQIIGHAIFCMHCGNRL
jgi:hypothetical protein